MDCRRTIVSPGCYSYGLQDWSPALHNSSSGLGRPGTTVDWPDWSFANTALTTLILTFYHPGVLRERFGKLVDMPPGIQNRSRDLASRGNISGSSNPSRPVRHSGTSDTSRLQEFPTPSINSSVCGSTIFDLWKNPSESSKVSDSYQFQHIPTIPIPENPFLVKGNLVVKFYSIIVVKMIRRTLLWTIE